MVHSAAMRIGLAQINVSMGAIRANAERAHRFLIESRKKGAELTVFPELALIGYPPKDLLLQEGFVAESLEVLDRLASDHSNDSFIIGIPEAASNSKGKGLFNSAAFVTGGKVVATQAKRLLPSYDVFDEVRYFDPGPSSMPISFLGSKMGLTICEDIWTDPELFGRNLYSEVPMKDLVRAQVNSVINISASPYHDGKEKIRVNLVEKLVEEFHLPLLYVNLVGGNDELLFDGGSFAVDANGKMIARAEVFREDLAMVDFPSKEGDLREWPKDEEEWRSRALVMGVRDYAKKNGFQKAVIGLSGGIDSSLVALLAVEALGAENVLGVSMPSRFTSAASREDAEALARALKIKFQTIAIDPITDAYENALALAFEGKSKDVTEENIQARVRGVLLMALSNKFGSLVLSTGNKSEIAVGYCTQYGDMVGGLAAISDLPKEGVYKMAYHLNQKWKAIPQRVFTRPPTAELRPNQRDDDTLPPYPKLDPILRLYIEEMKGIESIVAAGFDRKTVTEVIRMVDRNEFKRKQAAPGLRLSAKAFGIGRRMPIARGSA